MSLSRRNAKAQHETGGVQKLSGAVNTEYAPNQRVLTVDGILGTVTAVYSTPFGGEEYDVTLDHGMGGGTYTASQLSHAPTAHEAVGLHLASDDYPVLSDILRDRPDIATPTVFHSSRTAQLTPGQRIMTFDGLSGTITGFAGDGKSSFTGAATRIYNVVLDNGMGGGQYAENDLRPQTGVNTPIMHQATVSGSQMDGSFEDTSDTAPYQEGGDLQTGAALAARDPKNPGMVTYENPHLTENSWNEDREHGDYQPEHHPMSREHYYPLGGGGDAQHGPLGNSTPKATKDYKPPKLYSQNSLDPDFGFHVTAAWSDVVKKAKRIRSEGHVRITAVSDGLVIGEVKGEHHVYEAGLQRLPGKTAIQAWSCGCKWGAYHWGADDDMSRFAGRQCSHSLALQYEAQARGMFGKNVIEDDHKPKWVPRKVVVKYDIDGGSNQMAKSSSMPAGSPLSFFASRNDTQSLLMVAQLEMDAAVNNAWGEPEPTDIQLAPKPFGATTQRDPKANPGSTGWASQGDPEGWVGVGSGSFGHSTRMASVNQMDDELAFEASRDASYLNDDFLFEAGYGTVPDKPSGDDQETENGYTQSGSTLRGETKPNALRGQIPEPPPTPDLNGPGYPSGPKGGQGASMPPGAPGSPQHKGDDPGAEATLKDKPEGALPSTDGGLSMAETGEDEAVPQDDQALTPPRTASVEQIIADFQRTAGASLMNGGGAPSREGSEIAQAAREHLAKTALRDYSPAEQQAIINEGSNARAKNLDRLQLEGTHYMDEDDDTWMS